MPDPAFCGGGGVASHEALGAKRRRDTRTRDRVPPGAPKSLQLGPLAQLVERCIRIAEISGSNPLRSTIFNSEGYRSGYNGLVSKTKRGENHPGVRIPLPPP